MTTDRRSFLAQLGALLVAPKLIAKKLQALSAPRWPWGNTPEPILFYDAASALPTMLPDASGNARHAFLVSRTVDKFVVFDHVLTDGEVARVSSALLRHNKNQTPT